MSLPDAADKLRALASRVRRNLPLNSDPERFHVEMSVIARAILDVADELDPTARRGRPDQGRDQPERPTSAGKGRVVVTTHTLVVAGKSIAVQRRRLPFSVHV